jgi:Ca2+-transporting ATPase
MSTTLEPVGHVPPEGWHARSAGEVADRLDVDPAHGLEPAEAARRLADHGLNRLDEQATRPRWLLFLDQFRNVLVGLLVAGAVIAALIGDVKDAVAIAVVLVFNACLGYVQERRAEASLDALRELLALSTRVRRGGRVVEVPAEQLVPGDVVLLEAGDRVPADGRVVETWSAQVDESSLTGESVPVSKQAGAQLDPDCPLGDRVTVAFMNTQVTQGRVVMVVVDTGMSTEIGRVAELVAEGDDSSTPLQRQLDRLGKRLATISGSIVAVYFLLGLLRGIEPAEVMISSVALIVAAIPEGLPAVVTLTLAIGTNRLARRGAIVRKLASVETLGSTSLICSDKTGTLTVNQMTARAVICADERLQVTGEGYQTQGKVRSGSTAPSDDGAAPDVRRRLAAAAVLCNDSHVGVANDGTSELVGDPTEGALVVLAVKLGLDVDTERAAAPRVLEVPFDSARKFMATFHGSDSDDVLLVCVKGAWEALEPRCTRVAGVDGDRPLDAPERARLAELVDGLAADGLRVLALAERTTTDAGRDDTAPDDVDSLLPLVDELTLLGLVGLLDPPRPEAIDAIATCREAGIAVRMITGDHALTATAIGRELGIGGATLTGADLDRLDDDELPAALDGVGIVARVSPQHKVRVVRASRARGDVVAMTGDGVNDAPALVAADIGIAMGITGTEVAKDSAEMVLVDDNFATITGAVEQGRGIYDNIVRFVRFQVGTNIGALTTFITAQLLAMPTPFNPIQILWINLIMDGPPAMALGVEPADPGSMHRPPRPADEQILTRDRMLRVFGTGAVMAAGTLGVLAFLTPSAGEAVALSAAFTTFVMFQVANALNVRAEHDSIFRRASMRNRPMWIALVAVVVLQALAVQTSLGERIFGTTALTWGQWGLCVAVATTVIWLEETVKAVRRRGDRSATTLASRART